MALKKRRKKAPKRTAQKTGPGKLFLYAAFFTSGIIVASLAFISLELAVLATGFLGIALYATVENRRRHFWEQAFTFKLKNTKNNQDKLTREMARNRNDIGVLKEGLDNIALGVEEQENTEAQEAMATKLTMLANTPRSSSALKTFKREDKTENIEYSSLSDTVVHELTHHAVRNNNINIFLQPIVRLPQRQAMFFEMFARIRARPGTYIPAGRYMDMAREENLMNDIDHSLLIQCLETIKKSTGKNTAAPFFINITTQTLKSAKFMKELLAFLSKNRDLASRMVFEIQQSEFDDMHPAILEILRGIGRLGCALSLDHVEHFDFDLKLMQVLKVRFIKIDAAALLKKSKSEKGATQIWRLKRQLEGNGIGVIIEKIENEYALKELLDFDIHYGQGFLFGKPDLQGVYRHTRKISRKAA